MLKTAMLVSALAISAPVFAQDTTQSANIPTTTAPAKPQTVTPDTTRSATAQAMPTEAVPASEAAPAEQAAAAAPQTAPANPTAPAEAAATPTAPASTTAPTDIAAAPAGATEPAAVTGASQIAQVVNTEFPTYDKNADTNLDKTEFGAWMVALKSASDPSAKAGDPATTKWVDGAFASADADKSKSVSKDELTKYLSQGAE